MSAEEVERVEDEEGGCPRLQPIRGFCVALAAAAVEENLAHFSATKGKSNNVLENIVK